ncbi:N-methylhydantoinase B [Mariprofundus ferrinatatus]|uniref:N-methylhydantoinase B n=1 Tax=Mariprofundus ferrinatatus TaxID=1921087 RepID=A0A2K8L3D8_9PROT|nr:hydantoinase B/oxoprolinase family protein [Mariprofundus ferrinatatus]ATX81850.1 N-methylhydantoinase B [Mariprofundus ferrinatatus]
MAFDVVKISLFAHRLSAICEEMGAVLKRSAISPNIRDREDFSCALFDEKGELIAQAAHVPVHLGSMAFAMRDVIPRFSWQAGDVVVFNDPFLGGTHLPDITVVTPVFVGGELVAFTAARAHHADIGGLSPGSMGVETSLEDEGVVISPCYWYRAAVEDPLLARVFFDRVRAPVERMGDLSAQRAAALLGGERLNELNAINLRGMFQALCDITEGYGRAAVKKIPDGSYSFEDRLEDDGCGSGPLTIRVKVSVSGESAHVDFTGTAGQSRGPVNCPLAVTAASVYYVFRCLMPAHTPQAAAVFHPITISAPEGCLVNAGNGAAVAAGNVETSQRIVDVLLGALANAIPEHIPAAAQGTMNNVIFGGRTSNEEWVYYETVAGGMGGHSEGNGLAAVQCHMTNTKNSSIEVLEMHYPLRIASYSLRHGSGGEGIYHGGDGLIREWMIMEDCHLSLLTERRNTAPYGLAGGEAGKCGSNSLWRNGEWHPLSAKGSFELQRGDRIRLETPGGGGFGKKDKR